MAYIMLFIVAHSPILPEYNISFFDMYKKVELKL